MIKTSDEFEDIVKRLAQLRDKMLDYKENHNPTLEYLDFVTLIDDIQNVNNWIVYAMDRTQMGWGVVMSIANHYNKIYTLP